MALKQVVVSDISGKDVPDEKHARIVVREHPSLPGGPVELDVSVEEAGKLADSKLDLVTLEVFEPNAAPRKVVLDAASLATAFKGVDLDAIVSNGRRVQDESRLARNRSGSGRRSSTPRAERIDYTSPEWFGVLHRGKVTEEEAAMVRGNIEQANKNRERNGQPAIDPKDEKEKKRYGF